MHIVYPDAGPGFWPIEAMANLAGAMLGASVEVRDGTGSYRVSSRVPLPPRRRNGDDLLLIAPTPRHLIELVQDAYRFRGHRHVAVWLIDSFWTDRTPRVGQSPLHIDQLYITDGDLVDDWQRTTHTNTAWLPWGSDVLGAWGESDHRSVDLLRMGRQPDAWSDDELTAHSAQEARLTFRPGPPFDASPLKSHANVQDALRASKTVLAFGNSHDRSTYTHPTREYVTGRWTDALAHGTQIAGIPPRCLATDVLLSEDALIEVPAEDAVQGVSIISEHLRSWTPRRARDIRVEALRRVDWRHRLGVIRDDFGVTAPRLDEALDQIASLAP